MTATPDTARARARLRRHACGLSQAARADRAVPRLLRRAAAGAVGLHAAGLDAGSRASISAPSGCSRWSARPTPSSSCGRRSSMRSTCRCSRALLGRRRGWLVLSQLLLIAAIVLLAFCDPAISPWLVALGALLVATASATQDIVIDAFRIESLDESEQAAGMASYVAAYRIGMLASTAGALFLVSGFEGLGFAKGAAWTCRLSRHGGAGRRRHRDRADRDRAREIRHRRGAITPRMRATIRSMRVATPPTAQLRRFPHARHGVRRAHLRRALQVLRRVRRRHDRAVRDRSRIFAQRLCRHRQGRRARRDADRRLRRRRRWRAPIRWPPACGSAPSCRWPRTSSSPGRRWSASIMWALTVTIIVENFTGAIGTVIFVAYLSALCNNPLHTATQYALLTALAAVGRTYLSAGAGFVAEAAGLADVLRDQRADRTAEPGAAGLAAAARPFRRLGQADAHHGRTTRTACAAGSPPPACPRRDNRARRRPARRARAASPSHWRRATGR